MNKLKAQKVKTRIPYIFHSFTKYKLHYPQDIVGVFVEYYGTLYNLKTDAATNPSPLRQIAQLNLPSLTEAPLASLNYPIQPNSIYSLPDCISPGPDGFTNKY